MAVIADIPTYELAISVTNGTSTQFTAAYIRQSIMARFGLRVGSYGGVLRVALADRGVYQLASAFTAYDVLLDQSQVTVLDAGSAVLNKLLTDFTASGSEYHHALADPTGHREVQIAMAFQSINPPVDAVPQEVVQLSGRYSEVLGGGQPQLNTVKAIAILADGHHGEINVYGPEEML